jgi:UDP-2,3-diacylglucosamine hydrolase
VLTGSKMRAPEPKVNQDRRLRAVLPGPYVGAVPTDQVVIVSDAHIGPGKGGTGPGFHRLLEMVPDLANHLVINGDLFDFWFEYGRVIPRDAFPTLAALSQVRKAGVELTITGGNHDRWGGDFWSREMGARFHPGPVEITLLGFRTFLAHGDGLSESRRASRIMHHVTRMSVTVKLFRWIHPDVGYWLADRMSGTLAEQTKSPEALQKAAEVQKEYAVGLLSRRPELDLVILGHTHRAALVENGRRRWYLNPGAWMNEGCYALLTKAGPELRILRT